MDLFTHIKATLGDDASFDEFMTKWSNELIRRRIIDCYRNELTTALKTLRDSQFEYLVPENPDPKLVYKFFYGTPLQFDTESDQNLFWDDVASRPYVTIPTCDVNHISYRRETRAT